MPVAWAGGSGDHPSLASLDHREGLLALHLLALSEETEAAMVLSASRPSSLF